MLSFGALWGLISAVVGLVAFHGLPRPWSGLGGPLRFEGGHRQIGTDDLACDCYHHALGVRVLGCLQCTPIACHGCLSLGCGSLKIDGPHLV